MTTSESQRFGNYELVTRLAVGGMGEIFLARQLGIAGFERLVIIKTLFLESSREPTAVDRFFDEARLAATLSHPNIVSIIEIGKADGAYFIAMEYIPGINLQELSRLIAMEKQVVPPRVAAAIVRMAALGLDYAHNSLDAAGRRTNLVHRDVSPQNIMIRNDGVVKIVDFGIAHAANQISRTETGSFHGKMHYVSPEQLEGRPLDARSDQFSLGVVMWELITQRRLFPADNLFEAARQIVQVPIVPLVVMVPDCPRELDEIVLRMLQRTPEARFASCADVAKVLQSYLDSSGGNADQEVAAFIASVAGSTLSERALRIQKLVASSVAQDQAGPERSVCPECQREQHAGAKYCSECGAALTPPEPTPEADAGALLDITLPDGPSSPGAPAGSSSVTFENGVQIVELDEAADAGDVIELAIAEDAGKHSQIKAPLRGRGGELQAIESALKAARGGETQVLLVVGEEGMGKTRMLDEAERAARELGFLIARARGARFGVPVALDVFRQWVIATCDLLSEVPRSPDELYQVTTADALSWLTKVELPLPLARRLAQLFDGTRGVVISNPEEHRRRLVAALMQFLLSAARTTPLCLLVDDVQHADPLSLDLARQLKARLPASPLMVLATCTPEDTDRLRLFDQRIELAPLSDDDLLLLVNDQLSLGEAPAPLVELVKAGARGNPLVIKRQVQSLLESHALFLQVDSWQLEENLADRRFTHPYDTVEQRLAHFQPEERYPLQVAAVAGEIFPVDLVEDACMACDTIFGDSGDWAVSGGLLQAPDKFSEIRQFTHGSTRSFLLQRLESDELTRVRLAVGAAYDRSARVARTVATEVNALHLLACPADTASAAYLESVARTLLSQGCYQLAADWLMHTLQLRLAALEAQRQYPQHLVAELYAIFDVVSQCLLHDEPMRVASLSQSLLERVPPDRAPNERALALRQRASALLELSQSTLALDCLDEALRLLPPRADPVVRASLQADRALAFEQTGDAREAVFQLTDALQTFGSSSVQSSEGLAERLELMSRLYLHLSHLYAQFERADLAEQSARRALELSQRADQPLGEIRALMLMATQAGAREDRSAALGRLAEAQSIAEEICDPWILAQVYLERGRALAEEDQSSAGEILNLAIFNATLSDQYQVLETARSALDSLG